MTTAKTNPPRADRLARDENATRDEAEGNKATRFDGDPTPKAAARSAFKPKDDTPLILEKKSGPRKPEK